MQLETRNLTKTYRGGKHAVADVSMRILATRQEVAWVTALLPDQLAAESSPTRWRVASKRSK